MPLAVPQFVDVGGAQWKILDRHAEQEAMWNTARYCKMIYACASRGAGKCIVEGGLVTMADGTVRAIEDVKADDHVVNVSRHLRRQTTKVVGLMNNGMRPTLNIRLSGRVLPCTDNHPLLVNGNHWVNAGDVRVNDLVAVLRSDPQFGTERMADDDLDFLAMWLAEGAAYTISNQTPAIVNRLHEVAAGWDLTPTSDDGCAWYLKMNAPRHDANLGVRHQARLLLERLGLWGRDSKTKFIPDCVFKLPRDQLARFLSVFYGCDGYCCPKTERGGRVAYTIGTGLANRLMVRQMSALLLKFGIRGSFTHRHHAARSRRTGQRFHSWRLETVCSDGIVRFAEEIGMLGKETAVQRALIAAKALTRPNCNDLLPITEQEFSDHVVIRRYHITPHNARIRGAAPDLLQNMSLWRNRNSRRVSRAMFEKIRKHSDGSFDNLADGDVVWERVVAIEDGGVRQTYDLEVEGEHNFIVEGAVVHNSEMAKRKLAMSLGIRKPWYDPRYFYAAPTYRQVKSVVWQDMLHFVPPSWIAPHGISHSELTIRTIFGSELKLFGLDSAQRMEGVQYDGGVVDEASDVDHGMVDRAILPALTHRDGWLWKIGVPKRFGIGAYEFKKQFLRAMRKRRESEANGTVPEEAAFIWPADGIVPQARLDFYRRTWDPQDFEEQFGAQWLEVGGGIYHSFSAAEDGTGNVRPCPYRPDLPIRVGMDFNVNPGAITLGHKVDNHFEVFDEFHLLNTNTQRMLDSLWNRYGTPGRNHRSGFWFYGDATGRARKTSAASSDYTQIFNDARFREVGRTIHWQKSNPPRTDRFACTNALIKNGENERRLLIDPRCTHLIDDYMHRAWREHTRELPTEEGMVGHHADSCDYIIWRVFPLRLNVMELPDVSISLPTQATLPNPGLTSQVPGYMDPRASRSLRINPLAGE